MKELGLFLLFSVGGFLSGSVMFCQILPKLFCNIDITEISDDRNPGATNVFVHCGIPMGLLCLFLDMSKGFLPVFLASRMTDWHQIGFALIMAAPVLGHAVAPFNGFRGGKCIATSFGLSIALLYITKAGLILAGLYILFSTVLIINPITKRSIVTFTLFGIISVCMLSAQGMHSLACGFGTVSAVAVMRHMRKCNAEQEKRDNSKAA